LRQLRSCDSDHHQRGRKLLLWLQSNVTLTGESRSCVKLLPVNYHGLNNVVTLVIGPVNWNTNGWQKVNLITNNTFYQLNATWRA
jgi:hypothetical protein